MKFSLAKGTNQELEATFSSPDRLTMSDGILCWIDNRDGIDDVFALALKDGKERRISTGFGHQNILFTKANKILWDESRYGFWVVHCYDWITGKDQTLWSSGAKQ